MSQGWKLDGTDFFSYGVFVSKSSGVLDMPRIVDVSDNWLDLYGKDYWQPVGDVLYQDNEIVLNCFIESDSFANFETAVDNFYSALFSPNQRVLTVPYTTSTITCYLEKDIKMKSSNYIRTLQIGVFTLRLTVRNDTRFKQITVYKADDSVRGVFDYDDKFKISKKLQGQNNASLTIQSTDILTIERNDYVLLSHVTGTTDKYYLERDPEVKKFSTNKYVTQLRFEYQGYLLNRVDFLILDNAEIPYWGTAEDVIDRLIENMELDYSGEFTKGTISSTTNINHYFSNQNCYQILQQLATTYGLEFDLKTVSGAVEISLIPQIGISTTPGLAYGPGNGLYTLTRDSINNEDLTTVLHAFGSTKNLPSTYAYTRLKCTTFPIESNKATYGSYSKTKNFDEIFPEYTGTVSNYTSSTVNDGVDLTQYIITDSGLPFDINDNLLEAITAKIVFKTGDLSGYEFQIKRYLDSTNEIYFMEFKNPRGGILPSAIIKPAIGDTYTLVDIDLPSSYVTDAETRLLSAANTYIATKDNPKVTYRGTVSRGYQYDVSLDGYDIGDKVPITDTDFGLSADELRISDLTYNVYYGGYELILSEAPLITFRENIVHRLDDVEKTQDANDDQEVIEIRKRRSTGYGVETELLEPSDQTIRHTFRTRRGTINALHLDYESGTLDYSITGLNTTAKYLGVDNDVNLKVGDLTVHNWLPDTLNLFDIRDVTNDYVNPENYDPIRTWTIAESNITLPTDDGYWLYAKVEKTDLVTTGSIVYDIEPNKRVDYDEDYLNYKLGYVDSVANDRTVSMLWGNAKTAEAGDELYDMEIHTGVEYGYLYNWPVVDDSRKIANTGFSVPTNAKWVTLRSYLDPGGSESSNVAGDKLKEIGTTYWNSPNAGSNSSGFGARGNGRRSTSDGQFLNLKVTTDFWALDQYDSNNAWVANLSYNSATFLVGNSISEKYYGHAVRLLKDTPTVEELALNDGDEAIPYVGNNGMIHRTVKIGTQVWTEDIVETKYRDGSLVSFEGVNSGYYTNTEWGALATEGRCSYDNDETNALDSTVVPVSVGDTLVFDNSITGEGTTANPFSTNKDHSALNELDFASAGHTGFAPLNSPTFTGIPAAPTASLGTDTTQIATTEFVQANAGTGNIDGGVANSIYLITQNIDGGSA